MDKETLTSIGSRVRSAIAHYCQSRARISINNTSVTTLLEEDSPPPLEAVPSTTIPQSSTSIQDLPSVHDITSVKNALSTLPSLKISNKKRIIVDIADTSDNSTKIINTTVSSTNNPSHNISLRPTLSTKRIKIHS